MDVDESVEGRLTTNRETIEQWAEEHDVSPVRMTQTGAMGEDSNPYQLRTEARQTEMMETITWDEFFQRVEDDDLVIVFHGEGADRPMEAIDREQAVSRAPLEASELEERLLGGETVTSELTETTVIERTIVEHATIESEIVDTEVLDSRVTDVRLRSREVGGCDVVDEDAFDEVDHARFEDMDQLTEGRKEDLSRAVSVEVDLDEDWVVTRELLERATIESRIVDVDVVETDEVESETLESSVEIEGVQQALLESSVIETEADPEEVIQSGTIQSEFHSDDVVRTRLNQRRVVEDTVAEQRLLRGTLTESEIRQVETRGSTSIETSFFDGDTLDAEVSPVGVTEYGTETDETEMGQTEGVRTMLMEEDEGKPVVDGNGETIGVVREVSRGAAYVDPEPGLVDRIKSTLGWGGGDGEFRLDEENIERIVDDEVKLSLPK